MANKMGVGNMKRLQLGIPDPNLFADIYMQVETGWLEWLEKLEELLGSLIWRNVKLRV